MQKVNCCCSVIAFISRKGQVVDAMVGAIFYLSQQCLIELLLLHAELVLHICQSLRLLDSNVMQEYALNDISSCSDRTDW